MPQLHGAPALALTALALCAASSAARSQANSRPDWSSRAGVLTLRQLFTVRCTCMKQVISCAVLCVLVFAWCGRSSHVCGALQTHKCTLTKVTVNAIVTYLSVHSGARSRAVHCASASTGLPMRHAVRPSGMAAHGSSVSSGSGCGVTQH